MVPYILAIDAGTTSSRAIVFDKDTKKIGLGQFEFPQYFTNNSWVEHNPKEIWASQQKAISSALKAAKIQPGALAAIGITNQRETTIVWDRQIGRAHV